MKLSEILSKITYWNAWFSNSKKMFSIRALKKNLLNPKYCFIYLYKSEDKLNYLLPNVIAINYHEFILRINMLNKKQNIVLLNNIHDVPDIYNMLKEKQYNVFGLEWGKYKDINELFKSVLKIK